MQALITQLIQQHKLTNLNHINAFKAVDRKLFLGSESVDKLWKTKVPSKEQYIDSLPKSLIDHAYNDHPLYIGYGATISAPHMHCLAVKLSEKYLVPGIKALDIGSGSGIFLALLSHILFKEESKPIDSSNKTMTLTSSSTSSSSSSSSPNSDIQIVGVDLVPQLVERSKLSLKLALKDSLYKKISVMALDLRPSFMVSGTKDESSSQIRASNIDIVKQKGPFQFIHVGCAVAQDPNGGIPQEYLDLLDDVSSFMILPLIEASGSQIFCSVTKVNKKVTVKKLFGVRYIPLTGLEEQLCSR